MAITYPPLFVRDEVDGVKVVRDEVMSSNLSQHLGKLIPVHGTRVLTLADGATVYGCRDCPMTGTRGQVKKHRGDEHGIAMGGTRRAGDDDAVATPLPYPSPEVQTMTVYELLELGQHIGEWETVLSHLQEENERLRAQLREETQARKSVERAHGQLKTRVARLIGAEV